jgi:hypothetical protein
MILRALGTAAAMTLALTPATAHKPLKEKELIAEPSKGYILVRVGNTSGNVTGVAFARLDPHSGKIIGDGKLNALSKKEYDAAIAAGGNFLSTDEATNTYLIPVNPGKWLISGAGATIFSLGTFGFQVKAGEVSDIGTVLVGREDGKSKIPEIAAAKLSGDLVEFGTMTNIVMTDAMLLKPPVEGAAIPKPLNGWVVRAAEIQRDLRFDNVYHGLVNRALGLPPMEHERLAKGDPLPAPASPPAIGSGN